MDPFHLSLITTDLAAQRRFYVELLGCAPARVGPNFADFDFFGHQLTFHARAEGLRLGYETLHFGAVIAEPLFHALRARLEQAAAQFVVAPQQQAQGTPDARWKMVFLDPSAYAIELKCYADPSRLLSPAPAYPRV